MMRRARWWIGDLLVLALTVAAGVGIVVFMGMLARR